MKKILSLSIIIVFSCIMTIYAGSKKTGETCMNDSECEFNSACSSGVCVKKKEFDFGSSGKTGKPCNIDADCIGSGSCVSNNFGKKVCSGN